MATPNGIDLGTGTTDGDTLVAYPSWEVRTFTLDTPVSLTAGQQIAIVARAIDASGAGYDWFHWAYFDPGGLSGGNSGISVNSGTSWTEQATQDRYFQTFAGATYRDQYAPGSGQQQGGYLGAENWAFQSYTVYTTTTITSIKLKLARSSALGAPGTITVSLQALGAPPPTNPTPENDSTGVDFSGLTLSWEDGGSSDSFDVYIGETGDLTLVSEAQEDTSYITTLAELETIFGASPINQKIYWRVDANLNGDTTTGTEWNFDPRPVAVSTTTPTADANDITLDGYISLWDASSNATSYDLYFGTLSGFTTYAGSTSDLTFELNSGNNLTYNRFYYWKVVAVNDFGYTDSGELTFSTIAILPPSPTLWDDTEGWYRALSETGIDGDEGVDWESASNPNVVATKNRLVAFAKNTLYYDA